MPRPPIVVITLHAALFPLGIALLPIGQLIGVPRSLSSSSSGDDPTVADIFVSWVPADDGTDPADTSGWRPRVEFALSHARDLGEAIEWLTDACNGITLDLSVETLSPASPVPLATWLDAQALGVLGEHCALQAEVEGLALATA